MMWLSLRRASLSAVVALGLAVACHGNDLSAPAAIPTSATRLSGARGGSPQAAPGATPNGRAPRPVSCAPRDPIVNSGTFGPAGGTLVFGNSRLVIPGGALRSTVTITATTLGDSSSTVHFEPEGLTFAKPAGLVLDGDGCSLDVEGGTPSIVYIGTDGQILEVIPAEYDPHWKAVAAPLAHFSGYAIAF